jgi:hypothetical protein
LEYIVQRRVLRFPEKRCVFFLFFFSFFFPLKLIVFIFQRKEPFSFETMTQNRVNN